MIDNVLQAVVNDLNAFISNLMKHNTDSVILSPLMSLDGSVAVSTENRIVCTLLNIEQEQLKLKVPKSNSVRTNPPVNFNLHVLFSAYYTNYLESLKIVSITLDFFQGKQVFTTANTPGLRGDVDKVFVELVNIDMNDFSNIWTALGSKHLPGVLFKFRIVSTGTN